MVMEKDRVLLACGEKSLWEAAVKPDNQATQKSNRKVSEHVISVPYGLGTSPFGLSVSNNFAGCYWSVTKAVIGWLKVNWKPVSSLQC